MLATPAQISLVNEQLFKNGAVATVCSRKKDQITYGSRQQLHRHSLKIMSGKLQNKSLFLSFPKIKMELSDLLHVLLVASCKTVQNKPCVAAIKSAYRGTGIKTDRQNLEGSDRSFADTDTDTATCTDCRPCNCHSAQ